VLAALPLSFFLGGTEFLRSGDLFVGLFKRAALRLYTAVTTNGPTLFFKHPQYCAGGAFC
jgi:hypothetical protein